MICWVAIPGGAADPWWLHPTERAILERLRDPNRRAAWSSGRLAAKRLIRDRLSEPISFVDISILSRIPRGRPCPAVQGRPLPWCLSISHSDRFAVAALGPAPGVAVGVDVSPLIIPGEGFLHNWFTRREREWIEADAANRAAVVWSLKEAVYKALNAGERFVPRAVEILPPSSVFACTYHGIPLALDCRVSRVPGTAEVIALVTTAQRG